MTTNAVIEAGVQPEPAGDPVLKRAVERLVAALRPSRIYLFGSHARGDATIDSDYDFMVVVDQRVGTGREMERQAYHALSGLGIAKDVVIITSARFDWLRAAAASLPSTVEREGHLLYAA